MKIQRREEQDLFPLQDWNPVLLLKCAIAVLSSTRLDEISKWKSILLDLCRVTAHVHETFFLTKPEQFTDFLFFTFPVPPSPGRKEIFVKSERLVNKELNQRQAHWFVEICQSLSGWLHICLRNNSYLYSARAAGQALAVWRRSASVRGFLVGIPNDSPASHWEGGEKSCLLCGWGTELWSFSFSLDLAWGLGSQSWSQQALCSHPHTHTHTHTHPFAGLWGRLVSRL